MKAKTWLAATVLMLVLVGTLAAQTAPAAPPPPPLPPPGQGMQHDMMHGEGGMQGMHEMHEMHMQQMKQMQEMQKELENMRGIMKQMRASFAGMSAKDKTAMELNAQLWDNLLKHMEDHLKQMRQMPGGMMHEHMMHGEGAGDAHHHQDAPPTPPAPPAQP